MMTANIVEGFKELGHKVYEFTEESQVINHSLQCFDLIIEFSNRHVDSSITKELENNYRKAIYINGEDFRDDHPYNIEWKCFRRPEDFPLYFRREMYTHSPRLPHEYSLQFGVYPKYLDFYNEDKEGFIYPSNGEYPNRREVIRYIQEKKLPIALGRKGNFRHSFTVTASNDYYQYINKAEVIISSLGWGEDTARFWEAVSTGACVISERFHLDLEHPFIDGENVLFFDHPYEIEGIIKKIQSGEIDAKEIGRKGREHALNHHMIMDRAQYVIDKALEYNMAYDG